MPSLPDKIYSWKKKITKIHSETLKRVSPGWLWRKEKMGCGNFWRSAAKVTRCSPPSQPLQALPALPAPPNLGAGVTPRKFLNGQTGESRDRRAGYILEKGFQCIFENIFLAIFVQGQFHGRECEQRQIKGICLMSLLYWIPLGCTSIVFSLFSIVKFKQVANILLKITNMKITHYIKKNLKICVFFSNFLWQEIVGWIDVERVLDLVGLAADPCIRFWI